MSGRFVHLHVHSHFSLLDGNTRIGGLVQAAVDAEMPALALTDHGNLHGVVEFVETAQNAGIKPIPGMEAYIARLSRREKSGGATGNYTDHVTLLAENDAGYKNLMKLTSRSYLEGFHRKPRIDKELLSEHREGLIVLSGCLSSELSRTVLHGHANEAERTIESFRELLGPDHYYLEVMNHGLPEQKTVCDALCALAKRTGVPLVATSDVHYLQQSDALAQEVQMCIGMGRTLEADGRLRMETDQFHFRTEAEMRAAFPHLPDAIERTAEIAERCHVELPLGERHLPDFETPDGTPPKEYFRRLCWDGVKARYDEITPEIEERLNREMAVIEEMGFTSYFLIVWDFIRYAREADVPVGPGRGSAAGSLVAYALGITQVCPLKYDLLFERFLNSSRISMPDIDIDFCRDGREKVIQYVREHYGEDRVSQIVTFGTLAAKASIRDAGRVLGIELKEVDRIAKKIPSTPGTKLAKALEDPELEAIRTETERNEQLFDVALKLEGLNRHTSTHAAGVVIGDQTLFEIVPLCTVQGEVNTQLSMNELEALGLLKMDFLGLKTLTILDQCAKLVKQNHGIEIDYDALPLDDKRTYQLLQKGETAAVFQLESSGMRELLVKMQPDCFEDIIAILALYRPGPLGSGMVDSYVNRKRGIEETRYPHPSLEPILAETRGILVYQEQVMRITNVLAGFTLNEADSLRKAMGKKKPEVMAKFREQFVSGAVEHDCEEAAAVEIWETMEYFAGYGFNKSHSTAYGLITYTTAWAKANYPREFMAAVISCDVANSDKVAVYLAECRRMGIEILPPDSLHSVAGCSTEGEGIRLGLSAIKGLGERAIEAVVEARRSLGRDRTVSALLEHLAPQSVNRAALEAMFKAGAFDWSGHSRAALFAHVENLLRESARAQADRLAGQASLFGDAAEAEVQETIPAVPEWPERELLRHEKEVLGFYLSANPLQRYADLLRRHGTASIEGLGGMDDGAVVTVGGIAGKPRVTTTKKGKTAGRKMALFDLIGVQGQVACVAFPDVYDECRTFLEEDAILLVSGTLDQSRDEPALKLASAKPLAGLLEEGRAGQLVIDLPDRHADFPGLLERLRGTLLPHRGENPVFFRLRRKASRPLVHRVGEEYFVRISDELVEQIDLLLGTGSASLR